MPKKIAVLMGGWSAEREVSLASGKAVVKALESLGYLAIPIDIKQEPQALILQLSELKPDVAFNALHGKFGEDGGMQGVLELLKIPYTHSGVMASALAMDKAMARKIFAAHKIPVAPGKVVKKADFAQGDPLARPYVVKPVNEGSSVGVQIIKEGDNKHPFAEAWPYGEEVLVESYIPGREITVAVMGDKALAALEIVPNQGFYDYGAKYTDGKASHIVPAPVPKNIYKKAMDLALKAHQALGCRGVSRADFRYDEAKAKLYILEVNTQPGMTALSLTPEIAAFCGISFPQLVDWMVKEAKCDG